VLQPGRILYDHVEGVSKQPLTERPPGTHKQTKQERRACRKTHLPQFPYSFPFRQGLSHLKSAHFRLFRPLIAWRRQSSVFRYLSELLYQFPYAYQRHKSLVPADVQSSPAPPSTVPRHKMCLTARLCASHSATRRSHFNLGLVTARVAGTLRPASPSTIFASAGGFDRPVPLRCCVSTRYGRV